MKRRFFLKAVGGLGLTASAPTASIGKLATPVAPAPAISGVVERATAIIQSNGACNLSMVERLMGLDPATAGMLRTHFTRTGFLSSVSTSGKMVRPAGDWFRSQLRKRLDHFRQSLSDPTPEEDETAPVLRSEAVEEKANADESGCETETASHDDGSTAISPDNQKA